MSTNMVKGRINVGNGVAKLALYTSRATLAQSSTWQFSYIYQPHNTDACVGICQEIKPYIKDTQSSTITEKTRQHPI